MRKENKKMKKIKIVFGFCIAATLMVVGCAKSEETAATSGCSTADSITSATTISAGGTIGGSDCGTNYSANVTVSGNAKLSGTVKVKSGATITFTPGTTISADTSKFTALIVERGGKINVNGTGTTYDGTCNASTDVVVFTSDKTAGSRSPQDWGGVVIHGAAPANATAKTAGNTDADAGAASDTEILTGPFGGTTVNDDSGTFRCARIEFAGRQIAADKEFNGLFLAGVGKATIIEYIQVHRGSDDGIEIFGGTVNVKNAIITDNQDDGFDVDDGWVGYAQNIAISNGTDGDNCIEYDGLGKDANRATHGILMNITCVGTPGNTGNSIVAARKNAGIRMYNSLIANFTDQWFAVSANTVGQNGAAGTTMNGITYGPYVVAFASNKIEKVVMNGNTVSSLTSTTPDQNFFCGNGNYTTATGSSAAIEDGDNCADTNLQTAGAQKATPVSVATLFPGGNGNNTAVAGLSTGLTAPATSANYWGQTAGIDDFTPTADIAITSAGNQTAINGDTVTAGNYAGAFAGGATWANNWTTFVRN
jgi:hypothetical protein